MGQRKLHILFANGVNLDLLGQREPDIYGRLSLAQIEASISERALKLAPMICDAALTMTWFQTNHEGEFLSRLTADYDGIIINPGAWTHTSLALADRLRALAIPVVEVHLSNIAAREAFRQHSYVAPHALGAVFGFGAESYLAALIGLLAKL